MPTFFDLTDTPNYLESVSTHHAKLLRGVQSMFSEGVHTFNGLNDLKVTAGSGLDINVARGAAFVTGDDATDQGNYFLYNGATRTLTHTAADGTNPRKDIVIARIYDSYVTGAADKASLEIIAGTPAGAPTAPATPNGAYKLATVDIAAGATTVGTITDNRVLSVHKRNAGWLASDMAFYPLEHTIGTGRKVQQGSVTVTTTAVATGLSGSFAVLSGFTAAPTIFFNTFSEDLHVALNPGHTSTGFRVLWRQLGTPIAASWTVYYIAVGV